MFESKKVIGVSWGRKLVSLLRLSEDFFGVINLDSLERRLIIMVWRVQIDGVNFDGVVDVMDVGCLKVTVGEDYIYG